ncbi:DUF4160 domain-containing protein [Bradyrhizobium sp.]
MATVAVVDGVKIMLYANEHPPPHFHAKFAEFHAVIDIDKLAIVRGSLPPSKSNAVIRWATGRQEVLRSAFVEAMAQRRVGPIK